MTDFNKELCDERHDNVDKELERMGKNMNGLDRKLWAIIVLLVANLGSFIAFLINAATK